jgi:hypothetical protein
MLDDPAVRRKLTVRVAKEAAKGATMAGLRKEPR